MQPGEPDDPTRRDFLGATAALGLCGCASRPASMTELPPIVFVHGNGDTAALWQTTIWRVESNGWPRERLHAIELPYPLARDVDDRPQPGRTSIGEYTAFLKAEVEKVLAVTGAPRIVLMANSRGGYAVRNYIQQAGGDRTVSHAILGGTPNHGVWYSMPGLPDGSEFAGAGPFLQALNRTKNAAGDEVTGPVRWLTIRSDRNDKYAQPDGVWLGKKGVPTGIGHDGPALKGATNVAIPGVDHRETAFSPAAFRVAHAFITGRAPSVDIVPEQRVVLGGRITGLGVDPADPASGNFADNLPLPGARLGIFAVDAATGERLGGPAYTQPIAADGRWGPFATVPGTRYEFVVTAPGYATTHIYRSPFPRSSGIVHMHPERVANEAERKAASLVVFSRPRGYFDPARDRMAFDGHMPPGVPPGAGVSTSRITPDGARTVAAEFNGEKIVGRSWPMAEDHVAILELTY